MRILFVIFLTVFSCSTVLGTAQYGDRIIYNGKEYTLDTDKLFGRYLMESYFEKYPDRHPGGSMMSTGLYRGYVSIFEIKDNILYLKDIVLPVSVATDEIGYYKTEWKSIINNVFSNQEVIKIDWLTGLLVLPFGETVGSLQFYGDNPTYENYILLEIDKGILKKEKQFDYKEYEEFKEKQFQALKKSEEYEKIKADFLKSRWSDDDISSWIQRNIIDYSSKILVE